MTIRILDDRSRNRFISAATMLALAVLMAGCGANMASRTAPQTLTIPHLSGTVFGGQQPIGGAAIHLYAASNSGYGATDTDILTTPVTTATDGSGLFDITGDYTCSTGQQMFIVALGGDPGSGTNSNLAIGAALGDCSSLLASTFININEVTTVATAFALAPFMTRYDSIGTSSANTAGLAQAFNSVNKLVNTGTGQASGPALPAGATAPVAEINSLADALATCVNSTGGVSGDGSACGKLFLYATPAGGTAPTDTIGAALQIARNPALNASLIYDLVTGEGPFQPHLQAPPNDWTMSVVYAPSGLSTPRSTTIDANGNVWVANSGNNTVVALNSGGTPLGGSPFSGNGLNAPAAIAMDASGNAWVANKGGANLSAFTSSGGMYAGSPFAPTGLSAPSALAFDATGNLWVANSGNNSVSEINSSDMSLLQITGAIIAAPSAIAVNPE